MTNIHIADFGCFRYGLPARTLCGVPVPQDAVQCIAPYEAEILCAGCRSALTSHVPGLAALGGILTSEPTRIVADTSFAREMRLRTAWRDSLFESIRTARAIEMAKIEEWRAAIARQADRIGNGRDTEAEVA